MEVALTGGRIAFAENCQPCHGAGGGGRPGYPALAAGAWMWGGTPEDIQQTITHGIRSGDPDARQSAMPRFGADGMLKPAGDRSRSPITSGPHSTAIVTAGQDVSAGAKMFADNCAVCHGAARPGQP